MPILPVHCRCSGGDNPGPVPKPIRHITTHQLCVMCEGKDGCETVHRVIIRNANGEVVSQKDFKSDGVTPFTLAQGCKIVDCTECHQKTPAPAPVTFPVSLCDLTGDCDDSDGGCVSFIRWMTLDPTTGKVTTIDKTAEGDPYEPIGIVSDCNLCPDCGEGTHCDPVPMCPGLDALDGCQAWELPPGVESVAVHVVCGPVFIRTCCGSDIQDVNHEHEIIRIDEPGTTMTWSAPPLGCNPGELCEGFCVWTACEEEDGCDGQAYVQYLARCDWTAESEGESESEDESWGGYEDPCEDD